MDRCAWCHQPFPELIPIELETLDRFAARHKTVRVWVCPRHEQDVRRFNDLYVRHGRTFLGSILILIMGLGLAGVVAPWVGEPALIVAGALVCALGVLVYVLPFTTPETIRMLGMAKAIRLARGLAIVIVLLGIVIAGLPAVLGL